MRMIGGVAFSILGLACGGGSDPVSSPGDALVGGESSAADAPWVAVGYLAEKDTPSEAVCGATLVGPGVIVTAAHCIYREKDRALVFRTARGGTMGVRSVHYHPGAHVESNGSFDAAHALRLNDLAYVILDGTVSDVAPAALSRETPKWAGCDVRIIAFGEGAGQASTGGCVVLRPEIAGDSILEIRPQGGAAVCHRDGDEGHAAMARDDAGRATLVGVYVGSVTQRFTDCKPNGQWLNGYEDVAGHIDFFEEAVRAGAREHGR